MKYLITNLYKLFTIILINGALLCSISLTTIGQETTKIGYELRTYLNEVPSNELIPMLVEGDSKGIKELTASLNGNIRLSIDNLFSLEIPAEKVLEFSQSNAVKLIEFSLKPGITLSDTMLIQTNVDSVIQRIDPLYKNYTGKGVLLGVIDSGIELDHPDFKDSSGNTRVLYVWDQGVAYNPSRKPGNYSYGVEWDSAAINAGLSTHDDKASEFGHGSMVTGAAASNGNASGTYRGIAPEVNIIAVATDFNKPNWLQTVAESVDYIFKKADSLGMPCVINASVGTYSGSHDGKDIAARLIDLLIKQKSSRAFVCAAGNAGNLNFHIQHAPQNDTVFTWFENEPAMFAGLGGVYFEIWSDTADFNHMEFAIGADKVLASNYEFRGRTSFNSVKNKVNQVTTDSIISLDGNHLAYINYYVEENQGRYKIEVAISDPDSSQYLFRLESRGVGKLDIWSDYAIFRSSTPVSTALPSSLQFPDILQYQKPDSLQTIVSSFTCLPSVITVGNYINRNSYVDFNGVTQNMGATPGQISNFSSLGPNRNNYLKPDLSSAGDFMMSSGRIGTLNQLKQIEPSKISIDGWHMRNGGTSMASPTVAGMVALYFEMCNTADYIEVKNKLINSAKQDQFTPSLPSPKWGHGKADAFQFLKSSSFPASLNLNSTDFCGIDSVLLRTNNSFTTYLWNTGDTASSIYVNQSQKYFAEVEDQSGCLVQTNEIELNFYPNPNQPTLIKNSDSLVINLIGEFQWYLNNSIINGATDSMYKALVNGLYFCNYTDTSTGCSINSDTLNIIMTRIENNKLKTYELYPNPNNGIFTLTIYKSSSAVLKIALYDVFGRLVYNEEKSNNKQHILLDYSLLSSGNYFLIINDDQRTISHRIIIE